MVTEIIQERRSRSKSNRISKGVRRDGEPSRLPWKKILNLFNKSKANKRYEGLVLCKVHHIRHRWKRFYRLITVIINKTRMGRRKPVGITRAKGLRLYFALDYVYVFKTRTAKHKKTWSISYFSWWISTCCSMLFNKVWETKSQVLLLIYSQFPLISHLIISCEHIKWCLSSTALESL